MYLVNLMISSVVLSHMQFHYGTVVGILSYAGAVRGRQRGIYHGFEAPILSGATAGSAWRRSRRRSAAA